MSSLSQRLTPLALVLWAACFWILQRAGTWLPFAAVGTGLGVAVVVSGAVPSTMVRPTTHTLFAGAMSGVAMVVVTHAGYNVVAWSWPSVLPETGRLMSLLNVVGFSAWVRSLLIVTIAATEELIFRGLLPAGRHHLLMVLLTVAYSLTSAPLGSALLVGCALVCGLIWGALRLATGSLVVPLMAHVIWDLGVLLVWPLPTPVH